MRRFLFLLILPLTAAATARAQAPSAAQKALLVGHWQDTADPNYGIDIVEKRPAVQPGKPGAENVLVISSHSCGGTTLGGRKISTRPDSGWYLLDVDEECLAVVSVSTTKLTLTPVGGRGNMLTYKRAAVKQK